MNLRNTLIIFTLFYGHCLVSYAGTPVAGIVIPSNKIKALAPHLQREIVRPKPNLYYRIPVRFPPAFYVQVAKDRFQSIPTNHIHLENETRCWRVLISGNDDCNAEIPFPEEYMISSSGEIDLLKYTRWVTEKVGLLKAREMLEDKMKALDQSHGKLEELVEQASKEKNFILKGSAARMTAEQRRRVGIAVVFGIDVVGNSKNRELIRRAAVKASELGFYGKVLETEPAVTYEENAKLMAPQIEDMLSKVDHLIIVAASKGVADTLIYLFDHTKQLGDEKKKKIKLMISLSGVVRGSTVAKWILKENALVPFAIRRLIQFLPGTPQKGIQSLINDPWEGREVESIHLNFPNLKWINFSMLPASPSGYIELSPISNFLQRAYYSTSENISPNDGLVESAATILPPGTQIPQWIVRGRGYHALANGTFIDGTPVASKDSSVEAGAEILDNFLRVLSVDFLGPSISNF
jgi:hypothetical protein